MDSRELFRRRISRATPEDQIFGAFIEGTVTSLGEEFKPSVMAAVQKASQNPKGWSLFSKYSALDWLELMDVAASTAVQEENITYEVAMLRMGRGSVRHVLRTSTGQIFGTLVGNDPHRVLSTTVISAKVFATWGERSYEKLGDKSARMRFRHEFMGPAWVQGFYQEVLQLRSGVTSVGLKIEDYEEPGMEFSVCYTW